MFIFFTVSREEGYISENSGVLFTVISNLFILSTTSISKIAR